MKHLMLCICVPILLLYPIYPIYTMIEQCRVCASHFYCETCWHALYRAIRFYRIFQREREKERIRRIDWIPEYVNYATSIAHPSSIIRISITRFFWFMTHRNIHRKISDLVCQLSRVSHSSDCKTHIYIFYNYIIDSRSTRSNSEVCRMRDLVVGKINVQQLTARVKMRTR